MPDRDGPVDWIAGLGNPGPEYEATRHNAGFWFVDALAREIGQPFSRERRLSVDRCRGALGNRSVHLVKPTLFMNHSGRALQACAHFYKLDPARLLVAHDELDLPEGVVKLKQGGGHGGHNGLRDLIAQLGTPDFWRLRIGIGHPGHKSQVTAHVLKRASAAGQQLIDDALQLAVQQSAALIDGDITRVTQTLHRHKP